MYRKILDWLREPSTVHREPYGRVKVRNPQIGDHIKLVGNQYFDKYNRPSGPSAYNDYQGVVTDVYGKNEFHMENETSGLVCPGTRHDGSSAERRTYELDGTVYITPKA